MTAVPGCKNIVANSAGRKVFAGPGRKSGCSCLRTKSRISQFRSQAFRSNASTEIRAEASKGTSRLLTGRRLTSQPRKPTSHELAGQARQHEPAPTPPRGSLIKRAPGGLLQRRDADRQQPDTAKQRQQAVETQQASENQQTVETQRASERQQASTPSVSPRLQQADAPEQHDTRAGTKRMYSQAAGRLSPKDWQVTTDWLAVDMQDGLLDEEIWKDLLTNCDLDPCQRPQATLYHQLGMSKADFAKICKTRRSNGLLQLRVPTIQTKLRFFKIELDLNDEDIRKLLVRCPRVMEHKIESTMRPHLDFLQELGVAKEDLGKIIQRAPWIFQFSRERTFQPRLDFLKDHLGISQEGMAKILVKQPSVLSYSIKFMQERIDFLTDNGVPLDAVAKTVVQHPQVLHYLPESMQEKVSYLKDIGMGSEDVTQAILRLPQLLALDVQRNMKPKYSYLRSQLGGTLNTLCNYPAYFSLSLPNRIIPRHRYLQMVRARPVTPFPMAYLKNSDDKFAAQVAGMPSAHFASFKHQMMSGTLR